MKIVEYFDKIRVINLPTRPDRRRQIARELSRHGMPLQPGKVELFEAIRPEDDGGFPTLGLHGGFLSHLGVLKEARAAGLARVLHIEDDLQISRRFEECQEALVDQLRNVEWGLVYFGHPIELESTPVPTLVPYSKPFVLAHFFGVNGIIFDRLVDFLERLRRRPPGHPDGGPMSIDGALNTFRAQNPDVVTWIANPNLGWQRSSRTDAHPLPWFDRTPVARDFVALLRRGRSWLESER